MASSSSPGLNYLRKKLSTVQIVQSDKSLTNRESRKNPNESPKNRVQNGSISRRRSAPGARSLKISQARTTTAASQRSKSNVGRDIIGIDDEDDDNGSRHFDDLNTSFTSTATDNMEVSEHYDDGHPPVTIDNINQNSKTTMKKNELINQYFTKLNTGGYYCKLCDGTKNSKKVSSHILVAHQTII
jgi:hypothetical protein